MYFKVCAVRQVRERTLRRGVERADIDVHSGIRGAAPEVQQLNFHAPARHTVAQSKTPQAYAEEY